MDKVFISSTFKDLEPYRNAAFKVALDLGLHPVGMENFGTDSRQTVDYCQGKVAECDLMILILAFRFGWVPSPEQSGDGTTSITEYEYIAANRNGIPVYILMANESWPGNLWDRNAERRKNILDLRATLNQPAVFFDYEKETSDNGEQLPIFSSKLRQELLRHNKKIEEPAIKPKKIVLNQIVTSKKESFPDRPFPLLAPIETPKLFGGREKEIEQLLIILRRSQPILGIFAFSGTGKSSLLQAGLIPKLRKMGTPIAITRFVDEPNLAGRLLDELFDFDGHALKIFTPAEFADMIFECGKVSNSTPVLILDQFEDSFKSQNRDLVLGRIGLLISASIRKASIESKPNCKWVLAYRQEYHGEICEWLQDILVYARTMQVTNIDTFPHSMARPDRFQSFVLQPMGKTIELDENSIIRPFLEAIQKPLLAKTKQGMLVYPWRMDEKDAYRIAKAFATARKKDPYSPLLPELQVVLSHILYNAIKKNRNILEVPQEIDSLIDEALRNHVVNGIIRAFPSHRDRQVRSERTKALLILRRLSDASGTRTTGLSAQILKTSFGKDGSKILEKLSSPDIRLIVPYAHELGLRFCLTHDRIAKIISGIANEDISVRNDVFDDTIIQIGLLVTKRTELFLHSNDDASANVNESDFRKIKLNLDALVWDNDRKLWWQEVIEQRKKRKRKLLFQFIAAFFVLILVASILGIGYLKLAKNSRENELIERVRDSEDPTFVISSVSELSNQFGYGLENISKLLEERSEKQLSNVLFYFSDSIKFNGYNAARILLAEAYLDRVRTIEEYGAIAAVADDEFRRFGSSNALALKGRLKQKMRKMFGSPPNQEIEWVSIPAGKFKMGCNKDLELRCFDGDGPQHNVKISEFKMMKYEVTVGLYKKLDKQHKSNHDIGDSIIYPVGMVNWYEAYAFAAWIGGRLPYEAEWEYAARAGQQTAFHSGNSIEDALSVGWYSDNSGVKIHPIGAKHKPNNFGLFDMHGNAREWCIDWYSGYLSEDQQNPIGPYTGTSRVTRSGSYMLGPHWARSAARFHATPETKFKHFGFRVVSD